MSLLSSRSKFSGRSTVEYADLAIIDLSQGFATESRAHLAAQVTRAKKTQGFFYAINHGYTSDQVSSMAYFPLYRFGKQ